MLVVCLLCSLFIFSQAGFAQQAGQSAGQATPEAGDQQPPPPTPQPPTTQPPTTQPPTTQPPTTQPPTTQPPTTQPPKPQPPPEKKTNPFETIPDEQKPQPAAPKLEAPKPTVEQNVAGQPPEDVIEGIEFRGNRRTPSDTLRALIITKKGDKYDLETLNRDFMALWNTARFDDLTMEREPGTTGWIIRFVITERRIVRSIKYDGLKSISVSEVLDRFKERKVGLSVESQYDPNKVQRAKVVLQEYLAERGRQFATVEPQIHQVPPSSLEVDFLVDEGPKVKVGEITFDGNDHESPLVLKRAMKNLHAIGIPYSIFFEELFPKTYDSTKLEEDQQRLELFYKDNGYFTAHTTDAKVQIVDVGGGKFRLPLIKSTKIGKGANIHISIEEGRLYHLNNVNIIGMRLFKTNEVPLKVFQMQPGDIFSTAKLRKGFTDLGKIYGQFGYIDFVASPNFEPVPNTDKIDLTLDFDEGKQFFVRRIDFSGNTTTRDRVIRRQLLVDEGDVFNTHLWELSILRLNQLGYFEVLKEEQAADIKRDTTHNTVDITLKVKERGKNTVQLNGGVSAIAGSFVGFSYSTNNFLGLGENLSLSTTLGTVQRSAQFGFTEPYFLDKPLQIGFTVFDSRYDFNQARQESILAGQNLTQLFNELGTNNLLNYISNSYGFTVFASYPLRRSFARVGISYGYTIQNVQTLTDAATTYFDYINFLHINGPNSLSGIRSSTITPSYTYNSVNHPINPTGGKSLSISMQFAGSVLGGNVNQIEPVVDAKYFHKSPINSKHVIGAHILGKWVTGYGGKVAPPFNRFYMGGENDIRGFNIFGISPIAFVPTNSIVPELNNNGTPLMQRSPNPANGCTVGPCQATVTIPSYQLVFPGGDTEGVVNLEYRIPIFGPVTLAAFVDAGIDKLSRGSQLALNPDRITSLNQQFPEAAFSNRAVIATGTQVPRMSTGLEIQVLLPVVNAPFRVYWAYNPLRVEENIQPPIVADRSYFPNVATFGNALANFGAPVPFFEQPSTFRFTIGRTF
jgi:outer membrane protein insertion porin family